MPPRRLSSAIGRRGQRPRVADNGERSGRLAPRRSASRSGTAATGSPTKSVSIQIPAGVISAKPQPKPGWKLTLKKGKLPVPGTLFGEKITTGLLSVTWSGGTAA